MFARLMIAGLVLGCAASAFAQDAAPATQPAGATGTWTWSFDGPGGQIDIVINLKQDGGKLTGTTTGFGGETVPIENGTFSDGNVSFKFVQDFDGNEVITTYTGRIVGDKFEGKTETTFSRKFTAKRTAK